MSGNRAALLIATGEYECRNILPLRAAAPDAHALAEVLVEPRIGGFDVQKLINEPEYHLRRAIERFFSARTTQDFLLVYLSCHGITDDDGRLYFATIDTDDDLLASTTLSAEFLNNSMNRSSARSIVILLDCCFSGSFFKPGAKGRNSVRLQDNFQSRGRVIITATNAVQSAWESKAAHDAPQLSVFTAALVEGLRTGAADLDRDGAVSVYDLYQYLYDQVQRVQPNQHPRMWALDIERNVFIGNNPIVPIALNSKLVALLDDPNADIRGRALEDLRRYLACSDVGTARAARQALEKLSTDDSQSVAERAQAIIASLAPDKYTIDGETSDGGNSSVSGVILVPSGVVLRHSSEVWSAAFSPDNKWFASGADGEAYIFSTADWEVKKVLKHSGRVASVTFSPDSRFLATGSWDNTAAVWTVKEGELELPIGQHAYVHAVAFSPDGRELAVGTQHGIKFEPFLTKRERESELHRVFFGSSEGYSPFLGLESSSPVLSVAYLTSAEAVFGIGELGVYDCAYIYVGKFKSGYGSENQHIRCDAPVQCVATTRDGQQFAAGDSSGTTQVWYRRNANKPRLTVQHEEWVSSVAFSSNGRWLATGSRDCTARVWDAQTGKERARVRQDDWANVVCFDSRGQLLAVSSADTIKIFRWDP